ncbi:O-antigen ligase family protein [Sporolactobacillus sp. KGMB 08714]|uniref:O-antigen ligase family protein n=1 Tax=Sporolactobacillus sp. KGMB 08714 TaxID=3064704 RepID=UPI002FBEEA83
MDKKILKYIIIFYPVLDIIYSISTQLFHTTFPIGQYVRILILFYLFIKFTKIRDKLIIISLLALLVIGEFTYAGFEIEALVADLQYISKVILFVTGIFSFDFIIKKRILTKDEIIKYIIQSSYIITISIILGLFGIGFSTYVGGRAGHKGLFLVQNAVTATLLIITPLNLYAFARTKYKRYLLSYCLALFSLLVIGTKAGIAGALLIIFFQSINFILKSKLNYLRLTLYFLSIGGLISALYFSWSTLKIFFNTQINNAIQWGGIYSYAVSNRDLHVEWIQNYIATNYNYNPLLQFGIGFNNANNVLIDHQFNIIEMDFYGLLYYSGIWVLLFICLIIFRRVLFAVAVLIKKRNDVKYFALFLSIMAGLVHAYYGGHVIYEALTAQYFACVLAICKSEYRAIKSEKKRVFSVRLGFPLSSLRVRGSTSRKKASNNS